LLAIVVWTVLIGGSIGFFAGLSALGLSGTTSALVGIPAFVVLVFALAELVRRRRFRSRD